jgi:hypothetical protein
MRGAHRVMRTAHQVHAEEGALGDFGMVLVQEYKNNDPGTDECAADFPRQEPLRDVVMPQRSFSRCEPGEERQLVVGSEGSEPSTGCQAAGTAQRSL